MLILVKDDKDGSEFFQVIKAAKEYYSAVSKIRKKRVTSTLNAIKSQPIHILTINIHVNQYFKNIKEYLIRFNFLYLV